jgi:hypothetical protein
MAKSAAQRSREYRDRKRQPRRPKRCHVCGEDFVPARSDAVYCSATCRSIARHDRVAIGGELATGLGPAAAKVVELAVAERGVIRNPSFSFVVKPKGRRGVEAEDRICVRTLEWLIRLLHDWRKLGAFQVRGAPPLEALGRWLRTNPDADLDTGERELRAFYRAHTGKPYRLPRHRIGEAPYMTPMLSDHAHRVLRTPMRWALRQRSDARGQMAGDCGVVALATVLRIPYARALEILGRQAFHGVSASLMTKQLKAHGYSARWCVAAGPISRIAEQWPTGRYLLFSNTHVAAMIDGHIDDHAAETAITIISAVQILSSPEEP